ncbi:MAG TPA: hypothetical protein VE954_26950 [Oligoflexus sp.]|uniref:hypothetical protein n=1 Tax=Oligoflexus sp. TaxID=1971216 RepID=UPI002D534564|nr:hypothetical protein [Oligoflexus sp.]HYX36763.1 hypothetical protein [Oligoflexus sp.]
MKHLLSGLLLSGLGTLISATHGWSAVPRSYGFLVPIGGGASAGDNGILKPAQVEIHGKALEKLQRNRDAGASVGSDICLLEHKPESPESEPGVALERGLFMAAGADESRIKTHYFESREKADSAAIDSLDLENCGIFYIPGGDQTVIHQLWVGTRLHLRMLDNLRNGSGIMGKSAGAALQGTLIYLPRITSATSTSSFMQKIQLRADELATIFLAQVLPNLPRFYIETHTGDRERSARALAILAAWEAGKSRSEKRAMALALDSDTGALIEFNPRLQAWTAEVIGARAAEFFIPDRRSWSALSPSAQASYLDMPSSLLLSGSKVQISGAKAGTILQRSPNVRSYALPSTTPHRSCLENLPRSIPGASEADGEAASQLYFRVTDPMTGKLVTMNEIEYAYLEGDLISTSKRGCAYWLTHAFDLDFGQPENRLNAQRYALGSGLTNISVALPTLMQARLGATSCRTGKAWIRLDPIQSGRSSSALIFDGRASLNRGVGTYVYEEYGANKPVQTGTWEKMRVHLLRPGSQFNLATGRVIL